MSGYWKCKNSTPTLSNKKNIKEKICRTLCLVVRFMAWLRDLIWDPFFPKYNVAYHNSKKSLLCLTQGALLWQKPGTTYLLWLKHTPNVVNIIREKGHVMWQFTHNCFRFIRLHHHTSEWIWLITIFNHIYSISICFVIKIRFKFQSDNQTFKFLFWLECQIVVRLNQKNIKY